HARADAVEGFHFAERLGEMNRFEHKKGLKVSGFLGSLCVVFTKGNGICYLCRLPTNRLKR
ncbi:MAG TPA: hypothetical protein PK228_08635, partial [Saprospiraceae bacterium]|nr:hypothetical protein [Saprospiraceae bacterium]